MRPPRIKVWGGEDSVHSVLSEFLIVLKLHLNPSLGGKCMGELSVVAMSADSETGLPGFDSQLLLSLWPYDLGQIP